MAHLCPWDIPPTARQLRDRYPGRVKGAFLWATAPNEDELSTPPSGVCVCARCMVVFHTGRTLVMGVMDLHCPCRRARVCAVRSRHIMHLRSRRRGTDTKSIKDMRTALVNSPALFLTVAHAAQIPLKRITDVLFFFFFFPFSPSLPLAFPLCTHGALHLKLNIMILISHRTY